jgi:hypothetical protein
LEWHVKRRRGRLSQEPPTLKGANVLITENSTVPFCIHLAETPDGHWRYFFSIHEGKPGGVFLEHLYFDGNRDRVGYEQIDAPQALIEATRNLFN